jgi:hypothetical protein
MESINITGLIAVAKTLGIPLTPGIVRNWLTRDLLSSEIGAGTPGRERIFSKIAATEILLFASIASMDVPLDVAGRVLRKWLPEVIKGAHYLVIARKPEGNWEGLILQGKETLEGATVNMSRPAGRFGDEPIRPAVPHPFVCIPAPEIIAALSGAVEEPKND